MRVGLLKTAPFTDDGVHRYLVTVKRALEREGHQVHVVGGGQPDVRKFDADDLVVVADAKWNHGKKADPSTLLRTVEAVGPDRCIVGVHCPLTTAGSDAQQLVRLVPRVWSNCRRNIAGFRDDAFVIPYIPYERTMDGGRAGPSGLVATGRLWDRRKRVLLPVEQGYVGSYLLAGSIGLFGQWVRSRLLALGAEMWGEEPSSGGKPWSVRWPDKGHGDSPCCVWYTGKYKHAADVAWQNARVHFSGVEVDWVGDPGHLEYVTLEAMDAGLQVVAPTHCIRDPLEYDSVIGFSSDDSSGDAVTYALQSDVFDHSHDLSLHDPQVFVRRLLSWEWDPVPSGLTEAEYQDALRDVRDPNLP